MNNIAIVDWSLNVECPKCKNDIDLSVNDDGYISVKIFSNRWSDLKGYECTCPICNNEFMLDGVEY